jgi:hypothetical protein
MLCLLLIERKKIKKEIEKQPGDFFPRADKP